MRTEFIGIGAERCHVVRAIKAAFAKGYFDICCVYRLPGYNPDTFAKWVNDLHCKSETDRNTTEAAKAYCVNYFLCPESDSPFEVEAAMLEVWPTADPKPVQVARIGRYTILREPINPGSTAE